MNLIVHNTNIHIKNVLLHQIHTGILALVYTNMIKYTLVKFYFFTGAYMKILITGAYGMLGSDLRDVLSSHVVIAAGSKDLDITDCENISLLCNDERPTIVWQFFRFGKNAEARLELAKIELFKQIVVVDNGCFQPRGRTQPVMEIGVSVDDLRQPNAAASNADVIIAERGITKTE